MDLTQLWRLMRRNPLRLLLVPLRSLCGSNTNSNRWDTPERRGAFVSKIPILLNRKSFDSSAYQIVRTRLLFELITNMRDHLLSTGVVVPVP